MVAQERLVHGFLGPRLAQQLTPSSLLVSCHPSSSSLRAQFYILAVAWKMLVKIKRAQIREQMAARKAAEGGDAAAAGGDAAAPAAGADAAPAVTPAAEKGGARRRRARD
jgi:hypothetical protein